MLLPIHRHDDAIKCTAENRQTFDVTPSRLQSDSRPRIVSPPLRFLRFAFLRTFDPLEDDVCDLLCGRGARTNDEYSPRSIASMRLFRRLVSSSNFSCCLRWLQKRSPHSAQTRLMSSRSFQSKELFKTATVGSSDTPIFAGSSAQTIRLKFSLAHCGTLYCGYSYRDLRPARADAMSSATSARVGGEPRGA